MDAGTVWTVWLILLGPVAGSFVTALAFRVCRDEPLLAARSRCASCGHVIGWSDLVPILSYVRLRGRCRWCSADIPRDVLWGEVAGLGLVLLIVMRGGPISVQILAACFQICLLGLFLTDRSCMRLPDVLTLPLLGFGLTLGGLHLTGGVPSAALAAVVGAGALWAVGALYAVVRGREALGFGDVKMMAGLSAAVGLTHIPLVTLIAACVALVFEALRQGGFSRLDRSKPIPFGCYLAIAGVCVWHILQ